MLRTTSALRKGCANFHRHNSYGCMPTSISQRTVLLSCNRRPKRDPSTHSRTYTPCKCILQRRLNEKTAVQAHTVAVSAAGEEGTTTDAAAADSLSGSVPAATAPRPQLSEHELRESCQKCVVRQAIMLAVKRQPCAHGFALPNWMPSNNGDGILTAPEAIME